MRHPMDAALDRLVDYPPGFRPVDLEDDLTTNAAANDVSHRYTPMGMGCSRADWLYLMELHFSSIIFRLC